MSSVIVAVMVPANKLFNMKITDKFDDSWLASIGFNQLEDVLKSVVTAVKSERESNSVLPEHGSNLFFEAFKLVPLNQVKVLILGMDPYPNKGIFNGLAFGNGQFNSTPKNIAASLRNISKEVDRSYPYNTGPFDYSLWSWAAQGVLLINTAHTVVEGSPGKHLALWHEFTKTVLLALKNKNDIVWMLWGNDAAAYEKYMVNTTHVSIKTGHPSPLNRTNPFVGSDCFLQCDAFLSNRNIEKIKWKI